MPPRFLANLERHAAYIKTIVCSSVKEKSMWTSNFNSLLSSMTNLVHVNLAFCYILYDMDWLENCPSIKHLIVTKCPNMSSMSLVRGTKTFCNLVYFECMNNDRVLSIQIVDIVESCTKLTHLNCYASGNMHHWMACKILDSCPDMLVFNLSSMHILDHSIDAMGWCQVTRRDYKHVLFSRNICHKVEEYMDIDRDVSYTAWMDLQLEKALED